MPPKGYRTLTLPIEMVEEIEKVIKENPQLGYTSLAEFVKDAIRSKLIEIELVERAKKGEIEPDKIITVRENKF
jgi:metal-responsive CopG/Arc/MetJ family transcriptional regulator